MSGDEVRAALEAGRIGDGREQLDICSELVGRRVLGIEELTRDELALVADALRQGAAEDKTEVPAA